MISAGTLLRSPRIYEWEVMIQRKHCLDATQNGRTIRRNVQAADEESAKARALWNFPEFVVDSVRKKP